MFKGISQSFTASAITKRTSSFTHKIAQSFTISSISSKVRSVKVLVMQSFDIKSAMSKASKLFRNIIQSVDIFGIVSRAYTNSDINYPTFSNYSDNNGTLFNSGIALFNVTIFSTNGTAFLEINGANYTATNKTASMYNVSVSLASAGVYPYYWGAWGNGTSHNYNISGIKYYSINGTITSPPSGGGGGGGGSQENVTSPAKKSNGFFYDILNTIDGVCAEDINFTNSSLKNDSFTIIKGTLNCGGKILVKWYYIIIPAIFVIFILFSKKGKKKLKNWGKK